MRHHRLTSSIARFIATAGGAGYSPIAPGTCGTLVAVPVAWACRETDTCWFIALVLMVSCFGAMAAARADRSWGTHDSQRIVIDEVAGYLLTVAFVDRGSPWTLAIGVVVFRVLDILKPPPIRWIDERVPGGVGVMLDDLVAGALGAVIMLLVSELGVG